MIHFLNTRDGQKGLLGKYYLQWPQESGYFKKHEAWKEKLNNTFSKQFLQVYHLTHSDSLSSLCHINSKINHKFYVFITKVMEYCQVFKSRYLETCFYLAQWAAAMFTGIAWNEHPYVFII